MKKPNRNVSEEVAYQFLNEIDTGFLSMIDVEGNPYVTPVNAVYCADEHCLYFHCSREGRRWDALHANNAVCFVGVLRHEIIGSRFITHYASVMVQGHAEYIEEESELRRTLIWMTERLAPGQLAQRPQVVDAYLSGVAMVKISIDTVTAKVNDDL